MMEVGAMLHSRLNPNWSAKRRWPNNGTAIERPSRACYGGQEFVRTTWVMEGTV